MLQMDNRQIKIIAILGAIIVGLISFITLGGKVPRLNSNTEDEVITQGVIRETDPHGDAGGLDSIQGLGQEESDKNQPIMVYIAGQVKNPGVIEVPEGCRLNEAIKMAGGFLEEADLLRINLATKVQDEGMYYIPMIGEEPPELASSVIGNSGASDKVNINMADQKLLETLPRIGPVMAQNIISYREENGPFKEIEDIKNVSGIGEKTFEGLKDLIATK